MRERGPAVRDLLNLSRLWFGMTVLGLALALAPSFANATPLPPWMVLKPGAIAYLDAEGDNSDPPGQRVVCKDRNARANLADDDALLLEPVGSRSGGCVVRRAFGLVRIDRIVAFGEKIGRSRVPLVAITSISEDWTGTVTGTALLPIIPKGTTLTQQAYVDFFRSRVIGVDRRGIPTNGYMIEHDTTVVLLRQNPPDGEHADLYVRVLTGAHRNEVVWTLLFIFPGAHWMQDPANIIP